MCLCAISAPQPFLLRTQDLVLTIFSQLTHLYFYLKRKKSYWSIIALQCCVSFYCAAK